MTDDDKRHMDTARRLWRDAAEREWLAQAYETLDKQVRVMDALYEAIQHIYSAPDVEGKLADKLIVHASRIVIRQCEMIMRHSGMTDLDRADLGDQAAPPSGEAREETVPW